MKIYLYRWHSLPCLELPPLASPTIPLLLPHHEGFCCSGQGVEPQGHSIEVKRLVIVTQGLPQAPFSCCGTTR